MPELSLHDIDQICRDISRQEITFSHLLEELIDHVCCDVEYEMHQGLDFTDAYKKVREKIGSRGLEKVQEETLYAVDTKYRIMKNLMKISGVTGAVLFGIAALFKIQHWPMASVMMTLGGMILVCAFLPSALVVLWKETHSTKRIMLFISAFLTGACFIAGALFKVNHWPFAGTILTVGAFTGIVLFIPSLLFSRLKDQENKVKRPVYIIGTAGAILFIAGFLFKIQHWPFATVFMITSLILLCIIAIPWYTILTWKEESHVNPMFIFLVIGTLLIVFPSAMLNLNLQHSYQDYYYPNNSDQNEMYNYLYKSNTSLIALYKDSVCYKRIEPLHSKTVALLTAISNIQEKMVQQSEGKPGSPAIGADQIRKTDNGSEIIYRQLSYIMDPAPVRDFLIDSCKSRQELNSSMADYSNFLAGFVPANDLPGYKKILDPETYLSFANGEPAFSSLMTGLYSLQIMKNGVLTLESSLLRGIVRNK
jgi:hypothetical protein